MVGGEQDCSLWQLWLAESARLLAFELGGGQHTVASPLLIKTSTKWVFSEGNGNSELGFPSKISSSKPKHS